MESNLKQSNINLSQKLNPIINHNPLPNINFISYNQNIPIQNQQTISSNQLISTINSESILTSTTNNESTLESANANQNNDQGKEISDDELINLDKKVIINYKNKKIEDQSNLISQLVIENELIRENYAESVSFFKHYIEMLEEKIEELKKTKSSEANNEANTIKVDHIGNFVKCEYCEEIMMNSELKVHNYNMINLKEVEYKISQKDLEGIEDSIIHGFDVNLIVNKQTQESKCYYIYNYLKLFCTI